MERKTKSVTLIKSDAIFPNGPENPPEFSSYKHSYTEYDRDGNIIAEIKYSPDGTVIEKQVYRFDEQGKHTEEINYLDEGEIAHHMTYEHDDEGRVTKAFKHYLDGSADTIHFKYDGNGNIVEKTTINSDEEEEAREEIVYENNRVVAHKWFEYDELLEEELFEHDKNGNVVHHKRRSRDDENSRWENSYDNKGNIIKTLKYSSDDQLVGRVIYSYNQQGKTVKIEEESGTGKVITEIGYDEKGNAVKQTETDDQGNINNQVMRQFNENNLVTEAEVFIDFHGKAINQEYILKYEYEFY